VNLGESMNRVSNQATKIETLGGKYQATEELTRRIHNIMIGSYEKGKSGENYLRSTMNALMKIGLVRANTPVKGKVVEYCVVFNDGRLLAIDSKGIATAQLETLFDETTPEAERGKIREQIRGKMKAKVQEVCQYVDPQTTLPCAIMAVPDSIVDLTSEIIPDAVKRNVMIVGYSAVAQLIVYFVKIHGFYSIKEDIAQLKDRLIAIQNEVSKLDQKFFENRFNRPLSMLTSSIQTMREVIGTVASHSSLEQGEAGDRSGLQEPERS